MPRIARVVAEGLPHHVTQRGNRRLPTFFEDGDYELYLRLMSEWLKKRDVAVWAYCLMPNHVHLIVVPATADGLRRGIGEAHRRYTRAINFREGWRGHLWQGRFASFPLDDGHLLASARYIERNPVAAGLVENPADYPWSSARPHLEGRDDILVYARPLLDMVGDWGTFIAEKTSKETIADLRHHERTGRPLGDDAFVQQLEKTTGRTLKRKKPGPTSTTTASNS